MAIVVKVKYEDTLRRFNAYTRKDGNIGLSLDGLKSKIYKLFQFTINTQFVITYVDEDNDIVTMADNNDLCDAFHQGLNPLRLQVSLINQTYQGTEKHTQSLPTTSKNISMPNSNVQTFDLRSICSDKTLKSLPEPVQKALMNFIKDCTVLTSSSSFNSLISDFVQGIIKLTAAKSQQVTGASNGSEVTNNASHNNDLEEPVITNFKSGLNDRAGRSGLPGGSNHGHASKNNAYGGENMHQVFYKYIQCNVCGMNPIVGPRYKSTLKEDYDVCHRCFCKSRSRAEYIKIDHNQMSFDHKYCLFIEAIDVSREVQGIGAPTEVQRYSSMNTESMHSIHGADTSYAKSVQVDHASAKTTVVPASDPSLTGSKVKYTLGRNAEDVAGMDQKLLHKFEEMGFNSSTRN